MAAVARSVHADPDMDTRDKLIRAVMTPRTPAVVAWLVVATGSLYADALAPTASGFRSSVSVGLWVVFAATLAVMVLPGALALTVTRVIVPANLITSLWAIAVIDDRSWSSHGIGTAAAAMAAGAVLHPAFGDRLVDAGSYGYERRFLLRVPGPILITLVGPMWALAAAGAMTGPLLLADQKWVLGSAAVVVGLAVSILAVRALHRLARRWLVFVPAGMVVHDHLTLAQPVLVARSEISAMGPAPATTDATDLTAQALGLALDVRLVRPAAVAVVKGRNAKQDQTVTAVLVTPTRPALVLQAAADQGIPIG